MQWWCRGAVAKVQMQQRSHARVQVAQSAGSEVVERWHSGGAEEKRCRGPDRELLR